jgi:threonine/homoserine/homoserine lactone efflux protein
MFYKQYLRGNMTSELTAFLIASLILAIIPGPAVIYIVTQTLGQGRSAGLASVGGIALGNFGNAATASVGLAAILAASSAAFFAVKIAGAAYLIFSASRHCAVHEPRKPTRRRDKPQRSGFFEMASSSPCLALGGIFVAVALCTDSLYVLTASALASTLRKQSHWRAYGQYLSAATFIGLGIYAAVANPRAMAK